MSVIHDKNRRLGQRKGDSFTFQFEGQDIVAWPGESVAAALLAADHLVLRKFEDGGATRGVMCGIGVCWECRCVVDDRPNTRSCMTNAAPGMQVRRQEGLE